MPVETFRGFAALPPDFGPCALTIGNFDGVHVGHRELMRRAVTLARLHGWRAAAMTFHPHPARVIAPDRAPCILTTPEQRIGIMSAEGIERVFVLPFTVETAKIGPEDFVREVLVRSLQARAVVVGEDFRFGHKHAGDARLLRQLGGECGFLTDLVPPVFLKGSRVSSSRIRDLVTRGRVGVACRLLGRPFALEGVVVEGRGIGRKQTVPTLNLRPDFEVIPGNGVYVTRTRAVATGERWDSVTNVGTRPTFASESLTIETFLLGELDQTPTEIEVEFLARIRGERKFETPDALKRRIFQDVASAKRYLRVREGRMR